MGARMMRRRVSSGQAVILSDDRAVKKWTSSDIGARSGGVSTSSLLNPCLPSPTACEIAFRSAGKPDTQLDAFLFVSISAMRAGCLILGKE